MADDSQATAAGGRTYTGYARLVPMYIMLLPIMIGIGVWFPDIPVVERLGAVIVSPAILSVLLSEKGRDRGLRKQSILWESWGGPLLTQYLRHRNTDISEYLRLEYHKKIQELLSRC